MLQNIQTEFAENLLEGLHDDSRLPIHFKIYQNNIRTTLLAVLTDIYPLLIKLLGEDFFRQCMQEYINRYPSRSGNLHDYGAYVADFLIEHPLTAHLDYLSEVAQFEWLCHELQFAANHLPLDVNKLTNLSPADMESLRFTLNPASALKTFHYPILRIIDLCDGKINEEINLAEGGMPLLIIRREFAIKLVPLTTAEFAFLQALNEFNSLSDALEAANAAKCEVAFHLEEKLPQWVRDQTLVDCY